MCPHPVVVLSDVMSSGDGTRDVRTPKPARRWGHGRLGLFVFLCVIVSFLVIIYNIERGIPVQKHMKKCKFPFCAAVAVAKKGK